VPSRIGLRGSVAHDQAPLMTLGNMRANGVRSLDVCCWLCHHRAILSADPWPDHVAMPAFGPRMVAPAVASSVPTPGRTGGRSRRGETMTGVQYRTGPDRRRSALVMLAGLPTGCNEAILPPTSVFTVFLPAHDGGVAVPGQGDRDALENVRTDRAATYQLAALLGPGTAPVPLTTFNTVIGSA
jgi:hypothetical protein